jgi:hypothetical protein
MPTWAICTERTKNKNRKKPKRIWTGAQRSRPREGDLQSIVLCCVTAMHAPRKQISQRRAVSLENAGKNEGIYAATEEGLHMSGDWNDDGVQYMKGKEWRCKCKAERFQCV